MHFLQSKYWKESKRNLGNEIFEVGEYFFHITTLPFGIKIGYMPRPDLNKIDWKLLNYTAKKAGCVFVTIDPINEKPVNNIPLAKDGIPSNFQIEPGTPIHLQENIVLDLTKSDEQLLADMKSKHRYNLKLAQKKGVTVGISDSNDALEEFLELYQKTATRQNYHGRNEKYLRTVWETLKKLSAENNPTATIATAYFEGKPLASWFLFLHEDTIYYPYGGSSEENKNIMAPFSLVWEIIQWGKVHGFNKFDTWGIKQSSQTKQVTTKTDQESANVSDESANEPQYDGFSRFKVGFGGEHIVYEDAVDLVINSLMYRLLKLAKKFRGF